MPTRRRSAAAAPCRRSSSRTSPLTYGHYSNSPGSPSRIRPRRTRCCVPWYRFTDLAGNAQALLGSLQRTIDVHDADIEAFRVDTRWRGRKSWKIL